jgi:hypothetical protein
MDDERALPWFVDDTALILDASTTMALQIGCPMVHLVAADLIGKWRALRLS